ncbi:hypothetical protein WJX73_000655 [Symbiochloris irregularis]|uniref:MYND-type domain-containing protein n=1 Tax=Symbiochloris irregularis TaxID=706552 RepID=A0AAW1NN62_9CHLO
MPARGKQSKTAGRTWPELTERDLRKVLKEMRVHVEDMKKGDEDALRELLSRSLGKLQGLPSAARSEDLLDPFSMDGCEPDEEFRMAFCHNRTLQEIASVQAGGSLNNAYLQYRETLALLALHHHEGMCSVALMQDKEQTIAIMMLLKGLKRGPGGSPLFEVQFLCSLKSNLPKEVLAAVQKALFPEGSEGTPTQTFTVKVLEAQLIKEVLLSNAARLSPEYKQDSKQEWGIEGTPFDVSFLMPAGLPDADQTESLDARCANKKCGKPASNCCGRCKVVRYCSTECQTAHRTTHALTCNYVATGPSAHMTMKDSIAHVERQLNAPQTDDGAPSASVHAQKKFLVKVQISPDMRNPHLIYDQRRSFQVFVTQQEQPAFTELARVVRQKGVQGLKAYMWARRDSDSSLRVFLEGMPARLPPW